jgi:hypothetical protein
VYAGFPSAVTSARRSLFNLDWHDLYTCPDQQVCCVRIVFVLFRIIMTLVCVL